MLGFTSLVHPETPAESVFGLQCANCGTTMYLPVDPNDDEGRVNWLAMRVAEGWKGTDDLVTYCSVCAPQFFTHTMS